MLKDFDFLYYIFKLNFFRKNKNKKKKKLKQKKEKTNAKGKFVEVL